MFGEEPANGSLTKELLGLVKKRAWRLVTQRNLTESQRKATLPSSALLRVSSAPGSPLTRCRTAGLGSLQGTSMCDFYKEASSPTALLSSVLAVVSSAPEAGKRAVSLDAGQAFLSAKVTGHLTHVRLDKTPAKLLVQVDKSLHYTPFLSGDGTLVAQLGKALCGCAESARLW